MTTLPADSLASRLEMGAVHLVASGNRLEELDRAPTDERILRGLWSRTESVGVVVRYEIPNETTTLGRRKRAEVAKIVLRFGMESSALFAVSEWPDVSVRPNCLLMLTSAQPRLFYLLSAQQRALDGKSKIEAYDLFLVGHESLLYHSSATERTFCAFDIGGLHVPAESVDFRIRGWKLGTT